MSKGLVWHGVPYFFRGQHRYIMLTRMAECSSQPPSFPYQGLCKDPCFGAGDISCGAWLPVEPPQARYIPTAQEDTRTHCHACRNHRERRRDAPHGQTPVPWPKTEAKRATPTKAPGWKLSSTSCGYEFCLKLLHTAKSCTT